ncbi:MAG: TIGR02710 family CRISPR-associated protein, partial [Planctomycetes bacterium]|nr:TIGR02710 family CRISPR-associated protein [Planctomycetota bacterium]
MPKALLMTVGTGQTRKDIAQALVFAIRQHNPDHVLFIATAKSQAETLPLVLGDAAVCGRHHDVAMVADEDDFEAICQQCRDLIRALASRGFGPGQLVADYTSGTKAMSAGLCLAAVDEGLDAISYIAGKRGDGGRVISGTERLITARPGLTQATRHLEAAIQYFNTYQFSAARAALERALAATADPEV